MILEHSTFGPKLFTVIFEYNKLLMNGVSVLYITKRVITGGHIYTEYS